MSKLKDAIEKWWNGEYVPHENDPSSGVIIIGGDYERHWTASLARRVVSFLASEWKWAIGIVISITALWIAFLKL